MDFALDVSKNSTPHPRFSPMLFSRSCRVLHFTFKSMIHFELIFCERYKVCVYIISIIVFALSYCSGTSFWKHSLFSIELFDVALQLYPWPPPDTNPWPNEVMRQCLEMLRPGEKILVKLPQVSASERWDPTEWCQLSPLFSRPQYSCTILGFVYVWEYEGTAGVEIQWGWLMKSSHKALITRT